MRIGIDVSMTADAKTGLPSYGRSLVEGFARIDQQNEYWLYRVTWSAFPAKLDAAVAPRKGNFKTVLGNIARKKLARRWHNENRKTLLGPPPDIYLSPFHNAPERWFPRLICVFHDVAFRVHPEFSTEANRVYCEQQWERATRYADRILTVSHFSKAEIVQHMGIAADRVDVVHEAADPMFCQVKGARIPDRLKAQIGNRPFVLYVGSIEPRKNLTTLIEAFATMHSRTKSNAVLAIAGGSGWKNSAIYAAIEQHGMKDKVHFLGFVTDPELIELYNTCTLFCYPSIYEGFGLPVIEAMSCGAPVITCRVASLPEVGGDAALYIDDPRDTAALSRLLQEVIEDPALQAKLRRDGLAQAARFHWDRTAQETLSLMQRTVANHSLDRTAVRMGVDERGLVDGFYDTEPAPEGAYRWMQSRGVLRLFLRTLSNALQVVAASPLKEATATLIAKVNGCTIGTALLYHGPRTFTFALPAHLPHQELVELVLEINYAMPPAMKGGDTRDLGARVYQVAFVQVD
ncbi:MAG: glycosyltransferase family 1 protein [Planctomycetes bacterium]|nr:glycosyltransferase family 1 protein [Planctomycetota bacterium]